MPPESARWEGVVAVFAGRVGRAGYGLVVSPMFEDAGVFHRVGEATDIVRKEMYEFEDKGGRHLALRPEGTAPVVRAYVQHRPTPPWKVWYLAPQLTEYLGDAAAAHFERVQQGLDALGIEHELAPRLVRGFDYYTSTTF